MVTPQTTHKHQVTVDLVTTCTKSERVREIAALWLEHRPHRVKPGQAKRLGSENVEVVRRAIGEIQTYKVERIRRDLKLVDDPDSGFNNPIMAKTHLGRQEDMITLWRDRRKKLRHERAAAKEAKAKNAAS